MAERVKNKVGHLGSSITHSIGSNVKVPFKKKQFDSDDEVISQYYHDIKRATKALKYIASQIHKIANGGVPQLFKSSMKGVELFGKLIGAESLYFEGIEDYYHEFDILQAQQELPTVHPKELNFEIPALNEQLYNYMVTLDRLTSKTLDDWDLFYQENKLRVVEMCGYLNDTLKVIKKRDKKQHVYEKLHKKLDKLMKKTSPLDEKEQKSMVILEKDLKDAKYVYEQLDDRVRSILPHVFLLLEEFVDSLTKIVLAKQIDTYKSIYDTMNYFTTYYGLMSDKETKDEGYDAIVDSWENAMTPVRLQIETFISIIHNKNPELIDNEIDDEDKTSKSSKMWDKMTKKMTTKTFSLKPKDHHNGLFNGYLIVDQLDAFLQFQNPNYNVSDTYFPTKVPPTPVIREPVATVKAPPLPPRQNTASSPVMLSTPRIGAPINLPSSPIPSTPTSATPKSYNRTSMDSDVESFGSDSIMSDIEDDDDDGEEESLLHAKSISTTNLVEDKEKKNARLMRVYNSSKNQLNRAPIHAPVTSIVKPTNNIFNTATSTTHKLDEFGKYFHKLEALGLDTQIKVAKYDFEGVEPGDLSFKEGEEVVIIFTFYDLEDVDRDTWSVGMVRGSEVRGSEVRGSDVRGSDVRVGLVPTTYFER